ncbi:TPA: transposase [Yersinia enterocolitica]|nr:transposase [Yersinia enterocolitica]HDL7608857.1 transposase [Yersinia enterocolitica]HDL7617114.1 transposase [Yersinia enterocolitica]HDL7650273.1 transposase [Yersinia enterocolitica]HDL7671246.1 transposase [Yersinia enterocolitica]
MAHARNIISEWRKDYNVYRPHSTRSDLTPLGVCSKRV